VRERHKKMLDRVLFSNVIGRKIGAKSQGKRRDVAGVTYRGRGEGEEGKRGFLTKDRGAGETSAESLEEERHLMADGRGMQQIFLGVEPTTGRTKKGAN